MNHSKPNTDSKPSLPKDAELSESVSGADFPVCIEDDFLDGVYPEDFSFSLDLSVHSTALSQSQNINQALHAAASGAKDPLAKHANEGIISPVQAAAEVRLSAHQQHDTNSAHLLSPIPDAAASSRISSSSPPLLPLDTSELRFLRTPSPSLPSQHHTSTPFRSHHPSLAKAVDHVEYPVNTFYGLPILLLTLLQQHRGIQHLYGL